MIKVQINICHKNCFYITYIYDLPNWLGCLQCWAIEFGIDSLRSDCTFYFSASNNPPPPLVDLEGLNELFIVGGAGDVNLDAIDPWESGNLFYLFKKGTFKEL